jgi:hypothetical protein
MLSVRRPPSLANEKRLAGGDPGRQPGSQFARTFCCKPYLSSRANFFLIDAISVLEELVRIGRNTSNIAIGKDFQSQPIYQRISKGSFAL